MFYSCVHLSVHCTDSLCFCCVCRTDKLDGLSLKKKLLQHEPRDMDEFLQLADDYETRQADTGKKHVSTRTSSSVSGPCTARFHSLIRHLLHVFGFSEFVADVFYAL